eukprot:6707682-Prymnesium_polylepis.1
MVRPKAAQLTSAVTTRQHARHEGCGPAWRSGVVTLKGRECVTRAAGTRRTGGECVFDGWAMLLRHDDDLRARSKAALQARRPLPASLRAQLLVIEVPQPTNAQHRVRHRCGSSIVARTARARNVHAAAGPRLRLTRRGVPAGLTLAV